MLEDIKKLIELSPARQSQVCYNATIKQHGKKINVTFKPTLEHFDLTRTGDRDTIALYSSMVFHTGLTVGILEHWCKENQKRFEIDINIPIDQESMLCPNFCNLIIMNKDFIINQTVAYVKFLNNRHQVDPGEFYEYDSSKCVRDLNFLLDALIFDIKYDTNQRTCQIMNEFWCSGRRQVRGVVEKVAYRYLRELVNDFISQNKIASVYQTEKVSEQKFLDKTIESVGVEKFNSLFDTFTKVVDQGIEHIPLIENAFPRNEDKIEMTIYE